MAYFSAIIYYLYVFYRVSLSVFSSVNPNNNVFLSFSNVFIRFNSYWLASFIFFLVSVSSRSNYDIFSDWELFFYFLRISNSLSLFSNISFLDLTSYWMMVLMLLRISFLFLKICSSKSDALVNDCINSALNDSRFPLMKSKSSSRATLFWFSVLLNKVDSFYVHSTSSLRLGWSTLDWW